MWTDIGIVLFDITLVSLCVSHWLIWDRLARLNSRLETLELDATHNMKISDDHNYRLNNLETWTQVHHAENIRDRGEGKNNVVPRIYGRD